jgi:hypothetical protein
VLLISGIAPIVTQYDRKSLPKYIVFVEEIHAMALNFIAENRVHFYTSLNGICGGQNGIGGGGHGGVVVKVLRYKPAGRDFDSRWCHWNFPLT